MDCDWDCWLGMASEGRLAAVLQNVSEISANKITHPPTKSWSERLLHHAIMFVWGEVISQVICLLVCIWLSYLLLSSGAAGFEIASK